MPDITTEPPANPYYVKLTSLFCVEMGGIGVQMQYLMYKTLFLGSN
jgi:hypothetical protein